PTLAHVDFVRRVHQVEAKVEAEVVANLVRLSAKHTFAALRFVRHGRADPLPSTASVATKVGVAAEQAD
ncbi:MAG: hypothetical protein AABM29_11930, partial [Actinomycetota bacterium]